MPGLVGYFADHPLEAGLIHAMAAPMRHRPAYQLRARTDGVWAMATIDLAAGRQAHWAGAPDGRYRLVAFGAIYESWALDAEDPAATLLSRWMASGTSALIDLNGEYLIVVWDRDEQRLTIVNDRLGLKRLQLWHDGTALAFASELKSLAVLPRVSRAINEQALAELLTFGHLQDDRTLLRDVTLLPPASVLAWQRGRLSITNYWQYVFRADPALEDIPRARDEYAARVQAAVARRLSGHERIGLLLSGGLDSRTLAGMVRRLRPLDPLLTWTTGHAHAHDVRYARQMARVLGSRHVTIDIPHTFLQDFAAEYAWVLDGMVSAHGCHRACVLPTLAQATDLVFIGFMGDVLAGGCPSLEPFLQISGGEALIEAGYRYRAVGFDDYLLSHALQGDVYARVRGLARETFARSVRAARVEQPLDGLVWVGLMQRQRLWNPPAQMDLMGVECRVATPFADPEVVDFAMRLPLTLRVGRRAYLSMICQEFPRLARVPRSGEGLPLVRSRLREALHWRRVLFERHALPKLTRGRFGGHSYASFVHCGDWFRAANRSFIEATLIDNPLLAEHFESEALNRVVRDFLDGSAPRDLMECIAALMSYVLFRRRLETLPVEKGQP